MEYKTCLWSRVMIILIIVYWCWRECWESICCSCNYFPKNFKFWTLLLISFCLGLFGLLNSVFVSLCYKFGLFKLMWGQLFSCFSENYFCLPMLWNLKFKVDLKIMSFDLNDFLHCYRKSIYVWIETLVLFAACFGGETNFSIAGQPKVFGT